MKPYALEKSGTILVDTSPLSMEAGDGQGLTASQVRSKRKEIRAARKAQTKAARQALKKDLRDAVGGEDD